MKGYYGGLLEKESKKRGKTTEREERAKRGFEDVTLFGGFIPGEI